MHPTSPAGLSLLLTFYHSFLGRALLFATVVWWETLACLVFCVHKHKSKRLDANVDAREVHRALVRQSMPNVGVQQGQHNGKTAQNTRNHQNAATLQAYSQSTIRESS
jgi:hypothetical protein